MSEGGPDAAERVNHVAILTHDTDRLVAFYREVFDAEIGATWCAARVRPGGGR